MSECIDEQLYNFIDSSCSLLEKLHITKGEFPKEQLKNFLKTENISGKCSSAKIAIKQIARKNSLLFDSSFCLVYTH